MLYTHFTQHEIDQITTILDLYLVNYEVLIHEDMIAQQNEDSKYVVNRLEENRRLTAIYNIIIEKEEFDRLPIVAVKKLEGLNIYPEMSEELFESDTSQIVPIKAGPEKSHKFIQILAIIFALTIFGIVAFRWVNKYVLSVFENS